MQNFSQPGKKLTLTAPYTVVSGAGALVGTIFGVALNDTTSGVAGEFTVEGVASLAKLSTAVFAVGQRVYWDNTNKRCDSDPSVGRQIGVAVAAAANPSSTGSVKIKEVGTNDAAPEQGPAAASHSDVGAATYTAAEILGGIIVRDPNGASRSDVLPTAAALVAAKPSAAVGDIIRCLMVNGADAAEVITLGAGSGGAFDANQQASARVCGQNTSKWIVIRLTNITPSSEAYVVYF